MKNNFKKLLTVIILVLSMTALAACSKDEPEKATPTENPTEAVTQAPETTPTEEVTATPEPTDTAEPTATDEPAPTEEPEVTGEAGEAGTVTDDITEPVVTETESGDVITDTDNVTDDSDVLPIDKVYHKFEGNIAPLSAQGGKLAQSFINAYYTYDAETVISLIAYDESKTAEIQEIYTSFEEMKESLSTVGDLSSLLKVEIIGGDTIDLDENLEYIQTGALVDVKATCSDIEVYTSQISATIPGLDGSYSGTYLNVIVGKYNGEYKVLNTRVVFDETTDDPDSITDDPNATPTPTPEPVDYKELLYKFSGNETAEDIAKLFAGSYTKLDMITMISCVAMNEETLEDTLGELDQTMLNVEALSAFINEDTFKITLGEEEQVSAEELAELEPKTTQIDWADVSDVVKFQMHTEMTLFEQTQVQDSYLYVGKYKGEYRILNADVFDEY